MIVYAIKEGTTIWSDNNADHKAGRVPLHQPLTVISERNQSWYAIRRPSNLSLQPQENYPDYWVKRSDVLLVLPTPPITPPITPPVTPSGPITDAMAAQALVVLIGWLKQ